MPSRVPGSSTLTSVIGRVREAVGQRQQLAVLEHRFGTGDPVPADHRPCKRRAQQMHPTCHSVLPLAAADSRPPCCPLTDRVRGPGSSLLDGSAPVIGFRSCARMIGQGGRRREIRVSARADHPLELPGRSRRVARGRAAAAATPPPSPVELRAPACRSASEPASGAATRDQRHAVHPLQHRRPQRHRRRNGRQRRPPARPRGAERRSAGGSAAPAATAGRSRRSTTGRRGSATPAATAASLAAANAIGVRLGGAGGHRAPSRRSTRSGRGSAWRTASPPARCARR